MSVARQAAHGVAWNMLLGVSSRIATLVGTVILTRIIAPDQYGPVLAASITVMMAGVLTSFAFGQSLIAKRAPAEIAIQALVLHVGLGVVAMTVVYALRGPIADLIDTPGMERYVLGYAFAHLLDRARYIPERLLMRALRFRTIATVNAVGEVVFVAVALASVQRWGADAIVYGAVVKAVIVAILYFSIAPRAEWLVRVRMRAADVRDLLTYGFPIMIAAVSDRAATRLDNFIMAAMFSPGVMAQYNMSYSLAEMPVNHIAEQIGEVLMPSFSRMEEEQRRRAVGRAAALMALVVTPLGVGLGAIAPTVVAAFFKAEWVAIAPMLAILSVMTVFRPMTWSAIAYAQAVQRTRLVMMSSFLRAILVLSLVAVCGALGGPLWACVGACFGYALHAVVTIAATGRAIGFAVWPYLIGVARPLVASVPMFLAVLGVRHAFEAAELPVALSLAAELVAGALVYAISAYVFVRPSVNELLRLGRDALRRRR